MTAFLRDYAIPAALRFLPASYDTPSARALLLAIALQESRCMARRQVRGPARGFWQFEAHGVKGVLKHPATSALAQAAMTGLAYPDTSVETAYAAIEHNDVLACVFARLLLATSSQPLSTEHEPEAGWQLYLETWRPGRPHHETWDGLYAVAWDAAKAA